MTVAEKAPKKWKANKKPAVQLVKVADGLLAPMQGDEYSREIVAGIKLGDVLHGAFTKARNPKFHRKFFAMLGVGFAAWEPGELETKHGPVTKQFEQFREDATILAGFYEQSIRLDGSVRVTAKSIAFGNMDELEFQRVYSAVADVILQRVLTNYTRDDLDTVVEQMLNFV